MFEKVNPAHPDKVADRIAGAIVDVAYTLSESPRIAVEVLLGHGMCNIIAETSVNISHEEVKKIVNRIAGNMEIRYTQVPQDENLANNQNEKIRCGDNGIFKGMPITFEENRLSCIAKYIYDEYPTDGKYVINNDYVIICQSCADSSKLANEVIQEFNTYTFVNPIGDWTGGVNIDSGATNRKLGSDMGHSITGGGLHGKDLSKADVSVNIYAWLKAQETGMPVELYCAIGDEEIDGKSYEEIVKIAKDYIDSVGGFEKFAEWGLV